VIGSKNSLLKPKSAKSSQSLSIYSLNGCFEILMCYFRAYHGPIPIAARSQALKAEQQKQQEVEALRQKDQSQGMSL
jgi:hypothetical protein